MSLCLTPKPWALPYPQSQFCCNYHFHVDAQMDIFSPDLSKSSRLMYLTAHLTSSSGDINLMWSKQSLWSPPTRPHLKSNPLLVFPSQYMALPFTHLLRPKSQESSLSLCLPTLPFFPTGPVNSISNIAHSIATPLVQATVISGLNFVSDLLTSLPTSSFPALHPISCIMARKVFKSYCPAQSLLMASYSR